MTNAELITALRNCSDGECSLCPYDDYELSTKGCEAKMMRDAADALEADEKLIAELERIMKSVQENSGINFRLWQEAEAQLQKEGKWIEQDNGNSIYFKCSVCGKNQYNVLLEMMQGEYRYCPNCGARMRGEHDEQADC